MIAIKTAPRSQKHRGFALPMTVLAVAGMMLMLIGLLSMLTLERKTARSYADATRADLALQSGLADAIATISPIASRDDTLVFRMENPDLNPLTATADETERLEFYTFGAQFEPSKKSWRILPFVSGLNELSTSGNVIDGKSIRTALQSFTPEAIAPIAKNDLTAPWAKWVTLPSNATSSYTMRYAWWVEDLQGRIDGRHAGADPRLLGLSTSEMGLFTLLNDKLEKDGAGPEDKLIAQRNNLRSAASTRMILAEAEAEKVEPYITYSLPKTIKSRPLIPYGYDYKMAGQPAPNLSDLIAQKDVEGIAEHIEENLPLFRTRQGGFPSGEDYLKTIAASMIDYADTDNEPTMGTGYRGVDSYPFVNELFDRYEWTGTANSQVTIRVTTYVELWNPSNVSVAGSFELENDNKHTIKIPPAASATFSKVVFPPKSVSIPANGFVVRECGFKDYTFPVGAFPPSTLEFPTETKDSTYRLRWNGKLIDWARGGVTRTTGTLQAGASKAKWKGNASPAHDHSIGQHGDPRASYYINAPIFPNNYDANSNWGGRALKPSISNANYREVKITRWPDRGSESKVGIVPGSDTKLPTTLALPATQSSMSPAFISNKPLEKLAELGNIFDPAQWTSVETVGTASPASGGGFTLAIGRPEYTMFDKPGMRAAQLLDLFSFTPTSVSATSLAPKVNLNTAPRPVLRALVAGQILNNDPINIGLYPAKDVSIGDRFADAVIATRNLSPLRSLSDLNSVRKDPTVARNAVNPIADTEPFFGSPLQYPAANRPSDTWDDAGREELFQRISNLVTFQGKTYRIIVRGEAVDKSGAVIGRRSSEFHVQIEPQRDAEGAILADKPLIIKTVYAKSL